MTQHPVWVFGGGGIAGIAWEVGLVAGLADEGVHVASESTIIGTSAGAVVGAQLCSGMSPADLYERQLTAQYESSAKIALPDLLRLAQAQMLARTPEQAAQRIGRMAARAPNASGDRRRRVADRLPSHEWSSRDLRVTAVDTETGALRVFTRDDGVGLVDAVAASCAVPFSSLPVEIEGRRYMDGGMRSTVNLDLAPGSGPVIALAPSTAALGSWARVSTQRAALGDRVVEVVRPDSESRRVQGADVMDNSVVPALLAAAREQGRVEASRVAAALGRRDVAGEARNGLAL
ncbi:MAG: patatin-like phospholipase family protein [Salinibacterium sp.]|nr:patatin-like phospholipase family protein [Salinibacterium sp.]